MYFVPAGLVSVVSGGQFAFSKDQLEDDYHTKVATQTKAEVADIGLEVHDLRGFRDLKKGDKVHFQRYGAVRLNSEKEDTIEYWVVNGKDLLVIEEAKNV